MEGAEQTPLIVAFTGRAWPGCNKKRDAERNRKRNGTISKQNHGGGVEPVFWTSSYELLDQLLTFSTGENQVLIAPGPEPLCPWPFISEAQHCRCQHHSECTLSVDIRVSCPFPKLLRSFPCEHESVAEVLRDFHTRLLKTAPSEVASYVTLDESQRCLHKHRTLPTLQVLSTSELKKSPRWRRKGASRPTVHCPEVPERMHSFP